MASRDARTHVEQLTRLCREGKQLTSFADFLGRTCPPSPQGWVSTILFGSSTQAADVYDVQPHQNDPFRESCLFWAWATGVRLEQTVLPGRARLGLFAYGPGGYRYLSRRRAALEQLLDTEGRPLDDFDPVALAQVLLDTLANQGPYTHALILSPRQLDSDSPVQGFDARGYRLNELEWERWRHTVTAPSCTGDEHQGWLLDCFTLYGWMHEKRTLCRLRYRVTCDPGHYRGRPSGFHIAERIEPLTEHMFRSVPAVRY